jgi:uncharacterized protein (TIGR00369 family)
LTSSLVFTSINVHIPPLLERRADSRRCALLCRVSYRLHRLSRRWAFHSLMRARAAPSSRVLRPNGNTITSEPVHGGWLSALLDSALGCAVHTVLPGGCGFTTLDLHVRFVRAVTVAISRLRAEAQVTHAGKRTATSFHGGISPRFVEKPREQTTMHEHLRIDSRPGGCGDYYPARSVVA